MCPHSCKCQTKRSHVDVTAVCRHEETGDRIVRSAFRHQISTVKEVNIRQRRYYNAPALSIAPNIWTKPMRNIVAGLIGLLTISIASEVSAREWLSQHNNTHPLVGVIWSVGDKTRISEDELAKRLGAADFALLGETHPNADHHLLQAWAIDMMAAKGRKPGVVFEMIPTSMAGDLEKHLRERPNDTAGLGKTLKWKDRSWPDWSIYEPIAKSATGHGLPILAGNLDLETIRTMSRKGLDVLSADEQKRLALQQPLPKEVNDALLDVLAESHCGMMPKKHLGPMVTVQRARDGAMAAALLEASATNDGSVLIAGAGHGRNDWAVPALIRSQRPDAKVLTIAFMEAVPDASEPADYLPDSPTAAPVYDILYFTPRAEVRDHCAELKKHFEKKKKSN